MTAFDEHAAIVGAVLDFIAEHRTFDPNSRNGGTPRGRIERLRRLHVSGAVSWSAGHDAVFRLFLHRAPLLAATVEPISFRDAYLSTDAPYDPLTLGGFDDLSHLVHNGLGDDRRIALYEKDGVRRIVDETVDDCVQSGGRNWPEKGFPRLDRDLGWMSGAKRTVLDIPKFLDAFAGDIASLPAGVPTGQELTDLWLARPYDDFSAVPRGPRP
jgi:hypothetical protein